MAVAIVVRHSASGIVAAVFRGRFLDHAAMTLALAGISMPSFWLGPLLAILFAVQLGWLPVSGSGTPLHLVLPAVTLGAALVRDPGADDALVSASKSCASSTCWPRARAGCRERARCCGTRSATA